MKLLFSIFISILFSISVFGQKEFHVYPKNHEENPGKSTGDGSLKNPWDLHTALNQKPNVVNGGDTIWLHGGIYTGRFVSTLESTLKNEYVTVSAVNGDRVIARLATEVLINPLRLIAQSLSRDEDLSFDEFQSRYLHAFLERGTARIIAEILIQMV